MEEVFEYSPPPPVKVDAGASHSSAPKANREGDVVESRLRVGDAFALFDAKTRATREGYEAPRLRLARLQREAAEVRAEIEDDSYDSSAAEMLHEVDDLILNLERMASGLRRAGRDDVAEMSFEEAVRAAKESVDSGVEKRRAAMSDDVPVAEQQPQIKSFDANPSLYLGNPGTGGEEKLPSLIVSRLAALRSLHEEGFEFAKRLRTAELEERVLRESLAANDQTARRVSEKVDALLRKLDSQ